MSGITLGKLRLTKWTRQVFFVLVISSGVDDSCLFYSYHNNKFLGKNHENKIISGRPTYLARGYVLNIKYHKKISFHKFVLQYAAT